MLKIILLQVFCFGLSLSLNAQECTNAMLAQKPGEWKTPGPKGSTPNVSATDLTREKATLSGIQKMIAAKYKPVGCVASVGNAFSGAYLPSGKNWVADNYWLTINILRYLCDANSADKSKYYTDVSTTTSFVITANAIHNMNYLFAAELADDELRGYLHLVRKPVKKDGIYFMGEEIIGDRYRKDKIMQFSWLVTYDDTLPFYYLSRKEYLLLNKKRLEKTIKEQGNESGYFTEFVNRINKYLQQPEDYLQEPAIAMWNDEERFNGFVEEGTNGSFLAVRPNLAYYRKNLKKSTPQFFHVQYTITQNELVFEENIDGIMNAIDFEKLRSMLGKDPVDVTATNKLPAPIKKN